MRNVFWLTVALASVSALAQSPAAPPTDCVTPPGPEAEALDGLWQLRLWPIDGQEQHPVSIGALLLEPHPEYPGSVRGRLQRSNDSGSDVQAQVAGDLIDADFNLDESANGQTMDAVWSGSPQACGIQLRGVRRPAQGRPEGGPALNFLLQKSRTRP